MKINSEWVVFCMKFGVWLIGFYLNCFILLFCVWMLCVDVSNFSWNCLLELLIFLEFMCFGGRWGGGGYFLDRFFVFRFFVF